MYVGTASNFSSAFNVTNCGDTSIKINTSCGNDYFMNSTDNIDIGSVAGADKVKFGTYIGAEIAYFGEDATTEIVSYVSLGAGVSKPASQFIMFPPTSVTVPTDKIYNVTVEFKAIGL